MVRGLYIAGTGMIAQRKSMNVIINNAVNVETAGYKADKVISQSFKDRLIDRINDPSILNQSSTVGNLNAGTHVDELVIDYTQGSLDGTGKKTDVALTGDGFFAVQTPDGERYTRAGNFVVDTQGYLCNPDGHRVLGSNNAPLQVGQGEFVIDSQGNITNGNGNVGQMKLVKFADNGELRKQGDNLYYNYGNTAVTPYDGTVKQGYLEMSNANTADVMVDMMTVQRVYESNQKMIQIIDESIGLAANQVGKV